MTLKAYFSNKHLNSYKFGNVSPGYMDFTYFPYFNDFLRSKKLRFGIVLNHKKMRFELWLMGQNVDIQNKYWELLKDTTWNKELVTKPRYSELEVVLVDDPDFNNLDSLSAQIEKEAMKNTEEILSYINHL